MSARRVLVAGIGNVLRGDDGFGPAVARTLVEGGLPPGVEVVELGIGGMHLVQHLLDGYDALVVIDAIDRDRPPGALYVLEPQVPAPDELTAAERYEAVGDPHRTTPGPALILARAAGALPPFVRLVGCQPGEVEEYSDRLSPPVAAALPAAVEAVRGLLADLGLVRPPEEPLTKAAG